MKETNCQACGKKIPARFKVCPFCGHKKFGVITINKVLYGIIFLLLAGIGIIIYLLPNKTPEPVKLVIMDNQSVPFKIIKEWYPNNTNSRIGLNIVVSDLITSAEAHSLVKELIIKYQNFTHVFISIFDNEEVAENYTKKGFPEAEIRKHYICQIVKNDFLNILDINWKRNGFEFQDESISN